MSSVWTVIGTIAQFVFSFGFIIFFHELGHFLAARLFKIEVEEFGFGFPPRMVKLFKIKGTLFSLNWIPFGAFVRPKGENDPNVAGGLAAANPWKRLGVLVAGPLMNFLVGILIFSVVFSQVGMPDTKSAQIIEINQNTPAETAGLQPGDIIRAVDGETITYLAQVGELIHEKLGQDVVLTIERGGQEQQITIVPRTEWPEGEGPMGVVTSNPTVDINWFQAVPYAFQWTGETCKQFITLPIRLIRGEISTDQARLVSPIGLYSIYSQARASQAEEEAQTPGLAVLNILWFFGNISVLLGLSNLLPIPALDGGRMLFVLPELIFKKRIPPKYENAINFISFILLIILMVFLFIQDIIHPIVLP